MNIYLSPHHDDVCFSIGHLAAQSGGALVNLFTQSDYVAVGMALPADRAARVTAISRIRREEDQRFVQEAQLMRHDLALPEPSLVGHRPFDLTDLEAEATTLSATLMPFLQTLLPEGGPDKASLYCPIGIGGHRNHISTLLAVRGALDALRPRCTVFLYEDLHYASVPRARDLGLRQVAQVFAGTMLSRIVLPLDPAQAERKMHWIGLYASQHRQPPRPADFTPASGAEPGPHEIVWQVC